MGEAQGTLFESEFNRLIKVQTFSQKNDLPCWRGAAARSGSPAGARRIAGREDSQSSPSGEDSLHGDRIAAGTALRPGNGFIHATLRERQVHTAHEAVSFMWQVIRQARQMARSFELRIDTGYTIGSVMDELSSKNVRFCGRLKKNAVIDRLAEPHLGRLPGRPPAGGYEKVIELGPYQAESWKHPQRLILVVVDKPDPKAGQLDLLPRYFFLVTNWPRTLRSGEQVLAHYRKRGTFAPFSGVSRRLGEFNEVIGPHLSSREFAENEVTMLLAMLAFNMTTMLRNEFEAAVGTSSDFNNRCYGRGARGQGRPPFVAPHRRECRFVLEGDDPTHWPASSRVAMESSARRQSPTLGSAAASRAPIVGSARLMPGRSVLLPTFSLTTPRHAPWEKGGVVCASNARRPNYPYCHWATLICEAADISNSSATPSMAKPLQQGTVSKTTPQRLFAY